MEVVQTEESLQMGQAPGEDTSVNSHSTGTASKATGERYGSAKKATLVVFKMASLEQSEAVDVFRQGMSSSSPSLLVCATVEVCHLLENYAQFGITSMHITGGEKALSHTRSRVVTLLIRIVCPSREGCRKSTSKRSWIMMCPYSSPQAIGSKIDRMSIQPLEYWRDRTIPWSS